MAGLHPGVKNIDPNDPRLYLYDPENPRSLLNIAPEKFVPTIRDCYCRSPKLIVQAEHKIREYTKPDDRDDIIRMAFWDAYNRATLPNPPKRMTVSDINRGYVADNLFLNRYIGNRVKMLWIITPPRSYADTMRRLLDRSLDRLMEVVDMPMINKKGEVDHRLIEKIIKIAQITDLRVKGAIPQTIRMDQRNLNVNIDANQSLHAGQSHGIPSMDQLLTQPLDQLEKISKKSSALAQKVMQLPGAGTIEAINLTDYPLSETPANLSEWERDNLLGGLETIEQEMLGLDDDKKGDF